MPEFLLGVLATEYEERLNDLRVLSAHAEWAQSKAWLASTDILLKDYSVDERNEKIHLYIFWKPVHNVDDIAYIEYVTTFGRHKKDFPERIWEYSNIAALYYVWSQKLKKTLSDEACKALLGAIRVLMKLIGLLEALDIAHIQEIREKKKMMAREKGGKVKNERYDTVKQEIVRLLQGEGPGKYETKQKAAESISEAVWHFSEHLTAEINAENQKLPTYQQTRKAPGLVKDNLIRQILDWSRKDEDVSAAFNRVVQPRKGRRSTKTKVERSDDVSE
ncbi:hypothetical protein LA374_19960 [Aeromonas schubertii]|uniref:Transposase n=1 Tax=Aeromonas schubertii TaxID=652 RepID=A0ABS7VHM7_9GAMM|nr:hypothetical protein [Aeromonas schubertii]MBZ6068463.1 hypothetical protein [Aeromonas schubertii]